MTRWIVRLEGAYPGTEDDLIINFIKLEKPIIVKRYIIQSICDIVPKKSHYTELPNVKEVSSETNETIPRERTAVILATLKKNKEKIGILLYLANEMTYEVRGLRPDNFVKEFRQDDKKLNEFITKITNEPNLFDDVNLVLPEDRF